MRTLIVDRSKLMRTILRRLCEDRGFLVFDEGTHEKAIAQIFQAAPDLMFVEGTCDPESLAFLKCCRSKVLREGVIVLVSTHEMPHRERRSAIMAGANYFLQKPFTSIQLDYILQLSRLERKTCIATSPIASSDLGGVGVATPEISVLFWEGCCV